MLKKQQYQVVLVKKILTILIALRNTIPENQLHLQLMKLVFQQLVLTALH